MEIDINNWEWVDVFFMVSPGTYYDQVSRL